MWYSSTAFAVRDRNAAMSEQVAWAIEHLSSFSRSPIGIWAGFDFYTVRPFHTIRAHQASLFA
jgi:hypothetical protein